MYLVPLLKKVCIPDQKVASLDPKSINAHLMSSVPEQCYLFIGVVR
jgi:hypothetical protein